ncbi:peptidoglycan-binding domain-containing protein [Yoonia sp.]|uniref:peptidoglycan-binding domain-containing protein n=1 Tax=Yoonia sp. TaxID=2212373 RepID=UPI00397520B3
MLITYAAEAGQRPFRPGRHDCALFAAGWGNASRNAMRMFQEQNGLPTTGAPDRATLKALGVQPGQ